MSAESTPEDYYDHQAAADLLLFRNEKNMKALRLEVPDLQKEFSDGVYIGKGKHPPSIRVTNPPGSLYYDKVSDFEQYQNGKDVNHRYTVTKYTNSKNKIFIIVKFTSDTKTNYAMV
ncbi:hypothetical protein Clacol_006945 [Clathrus columnatus]|uniref:Uncharacterized protein n=1 Tax=Clathrus columnatus TaxID=1419009 RepID=A0AAV5AIE9_9AGAM|nr:hypothetical protein Clacol_006945 [Clathrus columnatus]